MDNFHYVIHSSFEIIKVVVTEPCIFLWLPASIAEAAGVIPNEAKIFFANGTATYNGPAILLNNELKNPLDWIILDIWVLDTFVSVDILFLIAFLNLVVLSCC